MHLARISSVHPFVIVFCDVEQGREGGVEMGGRGGGGRHCCSVTI